MQIKLVVAALIALFAIGFWDASTDERILLALGLVLVFGMAGGVPSS